jgi:two-component system, cell cycle sensor histidine kinase and response regulator CckA
MLYGPRLHDAARNDSPDGSANEGATSARPPDRQTIVVVDDDADVRAATRQMLEPFGYEVVEAADGVDAIGAVRERSGAIALVLTDVVMWRMGGGELSACLSSLFPGTRILFMSGYREDVLRRQGLLPVGAAFVAKPFEPDALVSRVRKLLRGA